MIDPKEDPSCRADSDGLILIIPFKQMLEVEDNLKLRPQTIAALPDLKQD